ncbi:MAG: polysaccharide deacetylase family protein [Bdellovibrionales bacterium]|nr:polysaccharide deacetylase family protein [Bdellovibrionales bacterium]
MNELKKLVFISVMAAFLCSAYAKEIALTFDDAPVSSTVYFETHKRTSKLIRKLKALSVPPVIIFANPCKRDDSNSIIVQLRAYTIAGHIIGNHTCSHPRLDKVGFDSFLEDALKADEILTPLYSGQKYFRYPFLNEGTDESARNQMRDWLGRNNYRNGLVSVDNDDTIVTDKIIKAKEQGKKVDHKKVEKLFLKHILSAAEFYDKLAVKNLGYSPKHVLLLHEMDGTVLYVDSLVKELRKNGWKIISAKEAYEDPLYLKTPKNTYAGNGIIAQLDYEKTGHKPKIGYYKWDELEKDLNKLLGLAP